LKLLSLKPQWLIPVAAAAMLAGCFGESAADLVPKARTQIEQGNLNSALINLKNALQKEPDSPEARFLLGKVLLELGDTVSAEVELRKALTAKHPEAQVIPLLARAQLVRGEYKKLLDEFGGVELADAAAAADLKTTIGTAQAATGSLDKARATAAEVLKRSPDHPRALMLVARLKATAGEIDAAVADVQRVLQAEPRNVDAWMLMAGLRQQVQKDTAAAVEGYRKVLEIKPDHAGAASALIALHLMKDDVPGATQAFEAMRKQLPGHPQTLMAAAQLATIKGDYKQAREHMQQLLRLAPENVRLLAFGGAIELELGSIAQAEALLNKAVQLAPDLTDARASLAKVYLQSGRPEKALHVLRPDSEATLTDARMMMLVAEAHLQNGDPAAAESFFNRAAKTRPADTKARTALAMLQVMKGDASGGLAQLQMLSAAGPDTTADMAMIAVQLRKGDADGALKSIDMLERKLAKPTPTVGALKGRAYLAKGDLDNARKSFEQALAVSPRHFPAIAALASLDLKQRKPQAAEQRFTELLKVEPRNGQALRAIAELRIRAGAPRDEVVQRLGDAIKADPADSSSRVMLVEYLISINDGKAAESAAQEAVTALPQSPEVVDVLGRAQLHAGNTQQAIASFNKLPQLQPRSPLPYLRLADAFLRGGNDAAATSNFRRALDIVPDLLIAQRGLVALAQRAKKYDEAMVVIRQVQKQRPNDAVGHLLEGELRMVQKNWDAAIAAFKVGLGKSTVGGVPTRLHAALVAAKREAEAAQFATTWLKEHPKDALFVKYLGDVAAAKRDFATAEKQFIELDRLEPGNAGVLNNIAWLQLQQNKAGAVKYAEQAVALAPNNASLLDTLAHALVEDKQNAKAVEVGKRALQANPDNLSLRFSIVKVFLKAGEKDLVKAELDRLTEAARGNAAAQAELSQIRSTLSR
jgi:cellulose synthase operon protein C